MTLASRSRQTNSPVQRTSLLAVCACRETYKPLASPVVFADDGCTHKVKYEPFDIPVAQFEATLINALQQIGVNAVPKRRN